MLKLYCLILAKIRFRKFLKRNIYLKNAITKEEKKYCERKLAQHIYKRDFGKN